MPRCNRKGCGQDFEISANQADSCRYHSGAPVFHEGLKSWSCCGDVNKPVLEFDQFMKIPGCEKGFHAEKEIPAPSQSSSSTTQASNEKDSTTSEVKAAFTSAEQHIPSSTAAMPLAAAPEKLVEEDDDVNFAVEAGTPCRRKGCSTKFTSNEVNRIGEGEGTVCIYHPAPPIFREGSKGYLCCKRRVLEFDEFLKIEGCKKGRHLFSPKLSNSGSNGEVEELVDCRADHYQTPSQVHVSIFAKKVIKDKSQVLFETDKLHLDLSLPGAKRCKRTINLFGKIKVEESKYTVLGTKVDIILAKADGKSWTILEKTDQDLGPIQLTFGTGGRTGTVGSKVIAT